MNNLERIAQKLLRRAVDDHGARSLGQIVVVVPTAESGRRLRLELARQAGGAIVPPEMRLPNQLLVDPEDERLASRSEELLSMREALGGTEKDFEAAASVLELRHILLEKAIDFSDVCATVGDREVTTDQWRELKELEVRYYDALQRRGKLDQIALAKQKLRLPQTSEVVRLDDECEWNGEAAAIPFEKIHPQATAESEAEAIADYFAAVRSDEAMPALCVADPEMFPEIVSAFEIRGLKVYNPARTRLATSSLGHLLLQLLALEKTRSYQVFSSFIRSGDARRWLKSELKLDDEKYSAALIDLDNRQAEYLPEKIEDIASKTSGTLRAIFETVQVQLRKRGVRGTLQSIFREFIIDDIDPAAREFAAAAECVNKILDEVDEALPPNSANAALRYELLAMLVNEATFSQEPDEGDVVLTDGWLELPFLEADELVIAGFQEGLVPESVVGHPFLPDSLRRELGLTDNTARTERDRAILASISNRLAWLSFHTVDSKGDVLKPSRLLFEHCDDQELFHRASRYYGIKTGIAEPVQMEMPPTWKLRLPIPPECCKLDKLSPTRLDGYLRCPFTYFLRDKTILGDKRMDDRAEELQSWEYGNLAHTALERFGLSELKDSIEESVIAGFLEECVDEQLVERFGTAIPAIVAMQGESVKGRLRNFAAVQAEHRRQGWRIVAVEHRLEVLYDHTRFHGKCDRIDYNESTGRYLVIDYKTWDSADKASCYNAKKDEWYSLQLPIYCAMLDADQGEQFASVKRDQISSVYAVLGKTRQDVCFTEPMGGELVVSADKKIRELIAKIKRGIFWPPGPGDEWRWDYADWLGDHPESAISEQWLVDQQRRLNEWEAEHHAAE